jgi:hypothetical protein
MNIIRDFWERKDLTIPTVLLGVFLVASGIITQHDAAIVVGVAGLGCFGLILWLGSEE